MWNSFSTDSNVAQSSEIRNRLRREDKELIVWDLLKIVFQNLLVNAVQAMQGKGAIRVTLEIVAGHSRVTLRDAGPGIADVQLALQDGYSTGRGLGLGLPGSRRLMDEFDIVSRRGKGTKVTMRKWLR